MLKLPICPYCHAVYSYKDIISVTKNSKYRCYHCKREFSVAKNSGRIILMLIVCTLLTVFNLVILYSSKALNLPLMIIINALGVSAAFLLFPLTVRFHPVKLTKSEKKKLKEN